jgi:hypothetical protein
MFDHAPASVGDRAHPSDAPLFAACLLLLLVGSLLPLQRLPQPDIAWPLYIARELLAGARLAVDFQEVNPPLFVWLSMPPVLLSKLTGAAAWQMTVVLDALLTAGTLLMTDSLLRSLPRNTTRGQRRLLLLLATVALVFVPRYDFGQREHLALIMTLPYALLVALRASGRRPDRGLPWFAGCLAGLGLALKPFFLTAWILVEVYLIARRGWNILLRLESVTLVATGATYLLCVLIFVPAYVPLAIAWREVYAIYRPNSLPLVLAPEPWAALPLFAFAVYVADRARGGREPLRDVLFLSTVGFWLAAILQGKGLPYHYLPAIGYGFLLLADIVVTGQGRRSIRPSGFVVRGATALVGVLPILLIVNLAWAAAEHRDPPYIDPDLQRLLPEVQREAVERRAVVVLSSNPASAWPLVSEGGARWGLRYMSLWMLAGFYHDQLADGKVARFRPLQERVGLERTFHEAVIEDLERFQPGALVVMTVDGSVMAWGGATRLDYLAYFSEDPRFRQFLGGYQVMRRTGRYLVLRRRQAAAMAPDFVPGDLPTTIRERPKG